MLDDEQLGSQARAVIAEPELLIAQARGDGLTLVTADENIARYDVAQLNARTREK